MKSHMTSRKVYGVWEYDREINDLNRLSEQGWQLEHGACFNSKFVRNEQLRYIYQLDYAPDLEDKDRYLSFFEEQGWEYINTTFNGWHYFRKPYREGMSEEETQIYTDKESLIEMQNRYLRGLVILAVVFCLLAVSNIIHLFLGSFTWNRLLETISCFLTSFILTITSCNIKRKQNGQEEITHIDVNIYLLLLVLIFIFSSLN